jgi:hypothetical protein
VRQVGQLSEVHRTCCRTPLDSPSPRSAYPHDLTANQPSWWFIPSGLYNSKGRFNGAASNTSSIFIRDMPRRAES